MGPSDGESASPTDDGSVARVRDRVRDRFLALVSHELRSPLNGIQNWAHVLDHQIDAAGNEDPLVKRALDGIRAGIAQQVQLIDDLLDTTMAVSGALEVERTPLALSDLLAQSIERLRPAAVDREVGVEGPAVAEHVIVGDERRLARALDHLLSNAIKFTPIGTRVRVTLARRAGMVVVRYEDEGAGFPLAVRQAMFEPFEQADESNARVTGGLGIGLTLARLIVELHGGRITIDEAEGLAGGAVSILLPLVNDRAAASNDEVAEVAAGAQTLPAIEAVDILVIDDQPDAREALRLLLVQLGAHVDVRESAESAITAMRASRRLPDAVICDIAMPKEDGYAFLRRFRQLERAAVAHDAHARHVPVIALSAFVAARPDDPGASAFDDYLEKPVSPDDLVNGIKRALARAHSSPSANGSAALSA